MSNFSPELAKVVANIFELTPDQIHADMSPETVDRWDSLTHLQLISAVEKSFAMRLTMEEIQSIDNLATLATLVQARAAA